MAVYRFSWLFAVTTQATEPQFSSPHSGGWSENFWDGNAINVNDASHIAQTQARAAMLPRGCSIIGWRQTTYNIVQNKLVPAASSSGRYNFPGGFDYPNLPQDSLELSIPGASPPYATRYVLRCVPDNQVDRGEYAPTDAFRNRVSTFELRFFTSALHGWVGRVLTNPATRVVSIAAGGILTTENNLVGAGPGSYIRFRRVIDDSGKPVSGSYRVTSAGGNSPYTLANLNQVVTNGNGTCRLDQIQFNLYGNNIARARAIVRKIGRPLEGYRGRRSRRRV